MTASRASLLDHFNDAVNDDNIELAAHLLANDSDNQINIHAPEPLFMGIVEQSYYIDYFRRVWPLCKKPTTVPTVLGLLAEEHGRPTIALGYYLIAAENHEPYACYHAALLLLKKQYSFACHQLIVKKFVINLFQASFDSPRLQLIECYLNHAIEFDVHHQQYRSLTKKIRQLDSLLEDDQLSLTREEQILIKTAQCEIVRHIPDHSKLSARSNLAVAHQLFLHEANLIPEHENQQCYTTILESALMRVNRFYTDFKEKESSEYKALKEEADCLRTLLLHTLERRLLNTQKLPAVTHAEHCSLWLSAHGISTDEHVFRKVTNSSS